MSQRNTLEAKRERRIRRSLSKDTLESRIDLVHWVRSRSSLTRGSAERLILSGALRVDSHKIGFTTTRDGKRFLQPYVSSDLRGRIQVVDPDAS